MLCVVVGYIVLNLVYAIVIFMMQKLGVTIQPCTNKDDQFPQRFVLRNVRTKGSCSTAHTDTHNEILVPYEDSIKKLACYVMDVKKLISLQLDHDRELRFSILILKI